MRQILRDLYLGTGIAWHIRLVESNAAKISDAVEEIHDTFNDTEGDKLDENATT